MRKKLVFFIALALALTQGLAAHGSPTTKAFRTYVGQEVTEMLNLTFVTEAEVTIDLDPDPPVVDRSTADGESSGMMMASGDSENYSLSIEGDNGQMFSADIVWVMVNTTNNEVSVKVAITYTPTEGGIHKATLSVIADNNTTRASLRLHGEAMTLNGDADGDGSVSVGDVTVLIDYLLSDDATGINSACADVDGDGNITVGDVSELVDMIIGVPAPTLCTFVIIEKTDGNSYEYMIDENSKVKILDVSDNKWLSIEIEGIGYIFPLNTLEQWRYEQKEVSRDNSSLMLHLDKESEGDSMTKAESLTLKTAML